jgi:hypothetical protein
MQLPDTASPHRTDRPEPFSTYVPRDLVRRLKVVSAVRDVPLWSLVTTALEQFLSTYEAEHGALPELAAAPSPSSRRR